MAPPKYQMTADVLRVFEYVRQHVPVLMTSDMKAIGLERNGELVAGVIYEGFNGRNVWMHVAITGQFTREYLRYVFHYPFIELGCDRVSGYVEASNTAARRFDEHLGFVPEARLKGAAADGGDVILYVMKKKGCRYVAQD